MEAPNVSFVFQQQMNLKMEKKKCSIDGASKALWVLHRIHTA